MSFDDRDDLAKALCQQKGQDWAALSNSQRDVWRAQADIGRESIALLAKTNPDLLKGLITSAMDEPDRRWLSDLDADHEGDKP